MTSLQEELAQRRFNRQADNVLAWVMVIAGLVAVLALVAYCVWFTSIILTIN